MIFLRSEGYSTPTVLAPTHGSFRHDPVAAKKKTTTSASTEANASAEARASADHALVTTTNDPGTNNREDNSEDPSIDDLTDGEFEVELLDMGVASEDIQAMGRIDARLAERLHHAQQAAT